MRNIEKLINDWQSVDKHSHKRRQELEEDVLKRRTPLAAPTQCMENMESREDE